jgi:hypothetical protein
MTRLCSLSTAEVTRQSRGGAYSAAGGAPRAPAASRAARRSGALAAQHRPAAPPPREGVAATACSGARRKGHVAVVWPGCGEKGEQRARVSASC